MDLRYEHKKNIKTYFLLLAFGFFVSCDCLQHVQGIVLDAETQLPIDSVIIVDKNLPDSLLTTDLIIYTDSIGGFDFSSKVVGLFGCPKISLSFKKEGYEITNKKYKSCCTEGIIVNLKHK
jgi:hypothetical protein